mgnify:CR=1 FL=1
MATTETLTLTDDGRFPNSTNPLVLHRGVAPGGADAGAGFARLFAEHGWTGGWRGTVFPFHHYHSTAHEVLGVIEGDATLQLGGDDGRTVEVRPGDVVVIPAGVAHRCLDDRGLVVTAAYDRGLRPDLLRGEPGERPSADERIARVPVPAADPVLGAGAGAGGWAYGVLDLP